MNLNLKFRPDGQDFVRGDKTAFTLNYNDGRALDKNGKGASGKLPGLGCDFLYKDGEAVGIFSKGVLLNTTDDALYNGKAPNDNGDGYVLYKDGLIFGIYDEDRKLNVNNTPFTGIGPSKSGETEYVYKNGDKIGRFDYDQKLKDNAGDLYNGAIKDHGEKRIYSKGEFVGSIGKNQKFHLGNSKTPHTGHAPDETGTRTGVYEKGIKIGYFNSSKKLLDCDGGLYCGSAPDQKGKYNTLYKDGKEIGTFDKSDRLIDVNDDWYDGMAPDKDGNTVCYINGREATDLNGSNILELKNGVLFDKKGNRFSGIVKTSDKHLAYHNGNKIKVLPKTFSELELRQRGIGDCYALINIYGVLSNKNTFNNINKNCKLHSDGSLSIKYDINEKIMKGNPIPILMDKDIKARMNKNGYDIIIKNNEITVSINPEKMNKILKDKNGCDTNSLFIKASEYIVGQMMRAPGDDITKTTAVHDLQNGLNGDALTANLMGYEAKMIYYPQKQNKNTLMTMLQDAHDNGKLLDDINKKGMRNGFIAVGIDYGKPIAGKIHDRHALALQSIKYDNKGEIKSVYLCNPHDVSAPEKYTIDELISRNVELVDITK